METRWRPVPRVATAARRLATAFAFAVLAVHAAPARAGCCDLPVEDSRGCYDSSDPLTCEVEFGGTQIPDPAICNYATTPPSCSGGTSSTTTTTTTIGPTSTIGVPTTSTIPLGGTWPGYSDDRVNPDPDEYYGVWCTYDQVDVWRAVPETELLKAIPIVDVISLPVGAERDLGDFMVVSRMSEDTVTIYGSNGNRAPEPGSKSFSLSACIDRNGGVPDSSVEPTGPAQDEPSTPEEETEYERRLRLQREHREAIDDCFSLYGAPERRDVERLVDCLDYAASAYEGSIADHCWLLLFRLRIGAELFLAPAMRAVAAAETKAFNFLALYLDLTRLRDEIFADIAGGRRATELYYASNRALVDAAIQNPAVLTAGRDALEAWAPVVHWLVRREGPAPAISDAQVSAFNAFLNAVRTGASPELRRALERETLLIDPASFVGLTPLQMVERLDRLSCEEALSFASIQCRVDDLSRIVDAQLAGKLRKRFASWLRKASRKAARAATAQGRKQHRLVRAVQHLLQKVGRQVEKKKIASRVPEEIRLVLGGEAGALQLETQALSP